MKIKIEVEFEVTSEVEGFEEQHAKDAAKLAMYHHGALSYNGLDVTEGSIVLWVDGHGQCKVELCDD